jgi:D-alanyl-D-alanine carboxypeptidase
MRVSTRVILILIVSTLVCPNLHAQLSSETTRRIDELTAKVLADTGTPSVSVAVVKDYKVAYVQAYGNTSVDSVTASRPDMRYKIGSISKQFTSMAILLLVQDGKLRLDDPCRQIFSYVDAGQ